MAKRLFVGNLSWGTTEQELQEAFGADSATIPTNEQGKSKGFGFVEFADEAAADAAIVKMNGRELGGRALNVNEARPRADRPARPAGGYDRGGDTNTNQSW